MADAGLFIGFGTPVHGREAEAIRIFNEAIEYYAGLQGNGEIESFEPVFLEPHGGDLGGFILLRGELEKLSRIRTSEEFVNLMTRASIVVENIGVVGADLGGRLASSMAYYEEQVGALTH